MNLIGPKVNNRVTVIPVVMQFQSHDLNRDEDEAPSIGAKARE